MSDRASSEQEFLNRTAEIVFADVYEDAPLSHLAPARQVFVMIYAAQGIIDNGGFRYFFERDFPQHPPYSSFSEAYREIGIRDVADSIERAASLFGITDPHLHQEARDRFFDEHCATDDCEICQLGDRAIDARHRVWAALAAYVRTHENEFKTG